MNWMDLLRMSCSNLRRRKLRTFLTVLGVIIGTASIVVMISLGLGLRQSMYQEIEENGGLTTIHVSGANGEGSMMMYGSMDDSQEQSEKYVDDACLEKLSELEHVESVEPVYTMSALLFKGSYEGYMELMAMTPEGLQARNIKLSEGTLPARNSGQLELVYGNMTLVNFQEKGTGSTYWETGELPDIDLMEDSLFLVLDQENYYSSQGQPAMGNSADDKDSSGGDSGSNKPVQKHIVRGCGLVEGGVDDYNANCYYIFCDLDTLKQVLKKEFAGRIIPGQPQTKSGKPMREFCYSYAQLKVDDADNVSEVSNQIKEMGYNVETNAEMMDSAKRQMGIIQAVLGGIGAVSLFVAAIGIANTMMMSIYERTKEIGVMKVLGCSLGNIRGMFLMEAAFIGVLGGIIGNVLSLLISVAINILTANSQMIETEGANISYIPIWLTLLAIGFAMLVGIVAGYFPAKRAMKLSPLEAIRNE